MANYQPPDQQQQNMYYPTQQPVYNPNIQQLYPPPLSNQQQYSPPLSNQQQYSPPPINQKQQQQQLNEHHGNQYHNNHSTAELTQGQPTTGVSPPSYENANYGDINQETGLPAKFNPRPKYNDCWAFVLFIAQLIAFIVLSGFAINKINDDRNENVVMHPPNSGYAYYDPSSDNFYWKQGLVATLIGTLTGLITAVLYFFLTQMIPGLLIKITFFVNLGVQIASAAYFFVRHQWLTAAFAAFFAILYAAMWVYWKSRIPFATEMLRAVTSISKAYPAMFAVSFLGVFLQAAYSAYFMVVIFGCYEMYYNIDENKTPAKLKILIFFCFVSFYWTSQVIKNITHVTISGVYACYYFLMGSPQGMSKSPTAESLKRACTTSIGSICLGSLIVSVIQALRGIAASVRGNGDDCLMIFLSCILDCILGCLQSIAAYINKYAYCQVAIYGKAYIPAARDTWKILKDRGVAQLINDNLVGNVWTMAAIMSGILSALGAYVYIWYDNPIFNYGDNLNYEICTMAFVMGFQMMFTVGSIIDSGCATTFVCLAEDPSALARTKPELFERIRATYPEVVQGVN